MKHDDAEQAVTEFMKVLTREEKIRFLREVLFRKNTGRKPRRWIEIENTLKARGL